MATEVYIARCVRSGSWWGVEIADAHGVHVKGGYTQARRLDQVDGMVREVISLLLDVPEDSFDVRLEPQLPADVLQEVEEARALRGKAEDVQRLATNAASRAAADLVKRERLTIRDAALILGLSHQRIDQLLERSPVRRRVVGRRGAVGDGRRGQCGSSALGEGAGPERVAVRLNAHDLN